LTQRLLWHRKGGGLLRSSLYPQGHRRATTCSLSQYLRREVCLCTFQYFLNGRKNLLGIRQQPRMRSLLGLCTEELYTLFGRNHMFLHRFYCFLQSIFIPRVWEFKNACFQLLAFGVENCKWPHFWSQFSDFTPKHLLLSSILLQNYSTMPFTAAQIVLFFKDQAYMTLTCCTATALATEGIAIPYDLFKFDKEGMNSIYCNLHKHAKVLHEGVAGICGELCEIQAYKLLAN
jgi:hypothetical protein